MNIDLLNETSVFKIKMKEKYIYLKIEWVNDEDFFHIKIFKEDVWTGVFTNTSATHYSNITEETLGDYRESVREALSSYNPMYTYDFTDGPSPKFIWKKKFEGTTVTMEHGTVLLSRDESDTKIELIDFLLETNTKLKRSLKDSVEQNVKLISSINECKKELEKHCDVKASIETALYGKFVKLEGPGFTSRKFGTIWSAALPSLGGWTWIPAWSF